MKVSQLFRKVHYWGTLIIAIPLIIIIGSGLLLMLKKEVVWIQPPTIQGTLEQAPPSVSLSELFNAAKSVKEANFTRWTELERVDFKPGKGIVKFVSSSNWEVQLDTHTAQVLQVAKRRSDLIETIHDGSFFADWTKLGLFLPVSLVLLVLWITGIYLFAVTEYTKLKKRARLRSKYRAEPNLSSAIKELN